MIGQNNTGMSLSEFQALQQQLIQAGYFYRQRYSIEVPSENYICKCCGSNILSSLTLFTYSTRMLQDDYPGFEHRPPIMDSRTFDLCFECWHVTEILMECSGDPDEN